MAFDGIVTRCVVNELNNCLLGAKVNKIYEPNKNEIIFDLYNGNKFYLKINITPDNCRINLTKYLKSNPQNVLNFCMLLRKYLIGSKIIEISNYDFERTVEIKFETYNEMNDLVVRKLYVEIMSRQSNIILCNENNIIIDTLKHFDDGKIVRLPANPFKYTPIYKTSFIELENFDEFIELISLNSEEKLSTKLIEIFIGFSKPFVLKTLEDLKIDDINYTENDLDKIFNFLNLFIKNIELNKIECVKYDKDYTLHIFDENKNKTVINEFIDEFYNRKENDNLFNSSKNNLFRVISTNLKKVSKKLFNINLKLKECEKMDEYKLNGELITANLYRFDNNENFEEVEVFNYYSNENVKIKLDSKYSISKNVELFYKKYNKLKNTLRIVTEQKKETEEELNYIESIIYSLDSCKTMSEIDDIYEEISENIVSKKDIKINNSYRNVYRKNEEIKVVPIAIDGFQVYVGKNNKQNEFLSLKFARSGDIWFHAQKIHGSHVILKNPNNDEIPEKVLYECALLAKNNSKASNDRNVSVDYCDIKYVKRAKNGKTGMVNYTNFETIIVK